MLRTLVIFSPSIVIDKTWEPVKKHRSDDMKAIEHDKEKLHIDQYYSADFEHMIETLHNVIKLMRASTKKTFSILVVNDGFANDPVFTKQSYYIIILVFRQSIQHKSLRRFILLLR